MKKRPSRQPEKQAGKKDNQKPNRKSRKEMPPISIPMTDRETNSDATADVVDAENDIQESNHPSVLRRGKVKSSDVQELSNFLIIQASSLNGIAKSMDRLGAAVLDKVDGVTKGNRGKKLIAEFVANLNRAVTDQQFG